MEEKNALNEKKLALDDARRVKVLSPAMLVFKRFIRNKLAITGTIILIAMFLFAFIGAIFSPYSQTQVFKGTETIIKDYATALYNTDLRFITKDDFKVTPSMKAEMILASNSGKDNFESDGINYHIDKLDENFFTIGKMVKVASILSIGKLMACTPEDGFTVSDALYESSCNAIAAGETSVIEDGVEYSIIKAGKEYSLNTYEAEAVASVLIFDANDNSNSNIVNSFDFRRNCQMALINNEQTFECDGVVYTLLIDDENSVVYDAAGNEFAAISDIVVETAASDVLLSLDFKGMARNAINEKKDSFIMVNADGKEVEYLINRVNANYYIKTNTESELIRMYEAPSSEHWLGTDGNGMDVLTRLMYGGRISLLVGFVVVFVEIFIGVIIGGIAGYFGGAIDTALMRVVDLFNSIPFWPIAIIFGSVMDTLEVTPIGRIFVLMFLLGILGWTGIARIVRGQILSLREQDFMVATEATGIRPSRRIFRHLVPNVMPLLIVQATMGLGGIIITEATLSFLGLGLKYPMASWGSILNAANDIFVMTNYWFIWIPAGVLIVTAVLGFNFVGDGLRDAFDPKMKR